MLYSKLFTKTIREAPKDEEAVNAQLLIRAGFIDKTMAGSYSFLPLGLKVLRNIEQIVREEMDAIGGQELLMSMLHPKSLWETTGGWSSIDVLFKIKSRTEKEYALGQSEEELISPIAGKYISSWKDLPFAPYQIHWKFRDELRAKSGILRGREFLMKDMYSFHATQEDFDRYFNVVKQAYFRIFKRLGLEAKATEASGGSFSQKISYEFMVLTDAGEDDILYCQHCEFCVNLEIAKQKENDACPKCGQGKLAKATASEAANVFDLGQKYTKDFNIYFTDEKGERQHPIMGCYGVGISRLMGILVEKYHDERGIIWPPSVAPYAVQLIRLNSKDPKIQKKILDESENLYTALEKSGMSVFFDDRETSAGAKFADADLFGLPYRIVVSEKTLEQNGVEIKLRSAQGSKIVTTKQLLKLLAKK